MPLKCCVPLCKSNYHSTETKISIYKFPKDPEERKRWSDAIPRANFIVTDYTAVCRLHWPDDAPFVTKYGKQRPLNSPSIFKKIPSSCLPTPPNKARKTMAASGFRNVLPDELNVFLKDDTLVFDDIQSMFINSNDCIVFQLNEKSLHIQSKIFKLGVPLFLMEIFDDFSFVAYHNGTTCNISSLTTNRLTLIKTKSALFEAIRFLKSKESSHQSNVLFEHLSAMRKVNVGEILYTPDIICRAYEYFAMRRSLYDRLCIDYKLPSIRTLTRLTSKISSMDDLNFINSILMNTDPMKRTCILLIDEVYVKASLLYQRGTLFGHAVNHPEKLATTILSFMIKCLFGGPEFICRAQPVATLSAEFQFAQCQPIVDTINNIDNGRALAIITDGNRINQRFFKTFKTVESKTWLSTSGTFLLYDYVHLLKSIRNNWLTEKTGQLQFLHNGALFLAKWSDLEMLYKAECNSLFKLSRLTAKSVYPKPIERQSVKLCLCVFCEETVAAFRTHPDIENKAFESTAIFIEKVISFWSVVNVKVPGASIRFRNELCGEIHSVDDPQLQILHETAELSNFMKPSGKRVKQLSQDTSIAIAHTCYGLIDLVKTLLSNGAKYVLLGWFSTDPIEKAFSKLRQGSGGTYFVNAKSVIEKIHIQHTKLSLKLDIVVDGIDGHTCDICCRDTSTDEKELLDNLHNLESSVNQSTLIAIVYMAGYVQKSEIKIYDDTTNYYYKYGNYLNSLNRGGLQIPTDTLVQWSLFCFLFFQGATGPFCRTFCITQFQFIAAKYGLKITKKQCRVYSNILLKNHALITTPSSNRESRMKILKLS